MDIIDSTEVTRDGLTFRVDIVPDYDAGRPEDEGDCWSRKDIKRWEQDRWQFVGVVVTLLDGNGDPTRFDDSLWACQYGTGDGWTSGMNYLSQVYPAPDMADELARQYREYREKHRGWWRYPPTPQKVSK